MRRRETAGAALPGITRLTAMVLLWIAVCISAARAQVTDTHPAELEGLWAHQGTPDSAGGVRWAIIHFERDGRFRGAQVLVLKSVAEREGEVTEGRWAVVVSQPRGALLCTRREGADRSRCNSYRWGSERKALTWDTLTFVPADSTLVRTLKLDGL
jgi:hypothetical protein